VVEAPISRKPFVEARVAAESFVEEPLPAEPFIQAPILADPVVDEPIVRRGDILGLSEAVPDPPESAVEEEPSILTSDDSWQSVAIEAEETDASVELTAEAIDLAAFVAELKAIGSGLEAHAEPPPADEPAALDSQPDMAMSETPDSRWSPAESEEIEPEIAAQPAADIPPPVAASAAPAVPEWIQLLTAIRNDIEQLRSDLPDSSAKSEKDANRDRDAAPAPPAPVDRSKKKKKKAPPPLQDEWGFFDPDQCGFAALLAKLDEISEEEDKPPKRSGR
jgi:hypothetical protein